MSEQEVNTNQNPLAPDAPDDPLTGHNYDGIQEYDNPTPAWWSWVFAATCIFAFLYMSLNLMATGGLSPKAEFERAKLANLQKKFGKIGELEPDETTILQYANAQEWVAMGKGVFLTHCTSCHGSNAAGSTAAPNLTDEHYIYVKSAADFADVITNGRGDGKMPAWGGRLHPNEIVLVASYLASIRGTNLPGKGAQGEVPPPWPKVPPLPEPSEDDE